VFPPGGPTGIVGPLVARHLSASFGLIVVDNRPGAGSTLGAKLSSGAEPDGDMLLFGSTASLAIASALYKNAAYNPLKSFDPVACWFYKGAVAARKI
jgi:tripartite-type tricarboxylate transporter receptor subunit TctC